MGKILYRNQPCIKCGSSDAAQGYEDGYFYCFSCKKSFKQELTQPKTDNFRRSHWEHNTLTAEEVMLLPSSGWKDRRLIKAAMEFYGVKVSYDDKGNIENYYFPCPNKSLTAVTGYHVRNINDKTKTHSIGTVEGVYGLDLFKTGGKRVVITEGQPDMLAVASAAYLKYNTFYPVVTMGAATNLKALLAARETLRLFDEIVLWFDNDEPGKKAAAEAAKILGYDKVKIVANPAKDANELFLSEPDIDKAARAVVFALFDAKPFCPSSILSTEEVWKKLTEYQELESTTYPASMEGLNKKTKGYRRGEITLFTSGSGSGKSSLVREIIFDALTNHKLSVGVIMLEEGPAETAKKLAGLALNTNLTEVDLPLEELRKGFDIVFEDDRLSVVDHVGASSDSRLLDLIEFMALQGVTHVVLDHITLAISEGVEGLTGNEAQDKFMNEIVRLVKRHNIWLGVISHLRKTSGGKSFEEGAMPSMDDIRGSGSTKQISMDIIAFARNSQAENEIEKNTIRLRVLKCRYTGLTGDAGLLRYDHQTGRYVEMDSAHQAEFELIQGV